MPSIWCHARLVADIAWMKLFVWVLGKMFVSAVDANGGVLDSALFFYDRYSGLAAFHRSKARIAKADRLAAIAEAHYRAAPDDDEPPEAAAVAMPIPRRRVNTNAISTTRVQRPPSKTTDLVPVPAP